MNNMGVSSFPSSRLAGGVLLLLSVAFFFYLNSCVPPITDDCFFHYLLKDYPENADAAVCTSDCETTISLKNESDMLRSLRNIRDWHNSRWGNALYIITNFYGGRTLVELVNAAAFFAFCLMAIRLFFRSFSFKTVLLTVLSAAILMPLWTRACMWHVASMSYTTGAAFLIAFLIGFYEDLQSERSKAGVFLTSVVCACCGAFHEGLGVPLLGALSAFCFVGILRRDKLPYGRILLYIGILAVASAWLLSAPGLQHRLHGSSVNKGVHAFIVYGGTFAAYMQHCSAAIIGFLCVVAVRKAKVWGDLLFYYILAASGVAVIGTTSWGGGYWFPCVAMYAYVMLYAAPWLQKRVGSCCCVILCGVTLFGAYQLWHSFRGLSDVFDETIDKARSSNVVECYLRDEDSDVNWMLRFALLDRILPQSPQAQYFKDYYGVQPFAVSLRTIAVPDDMWEQLPAETTDNAFWCKNKDVILILLPEGYSLAPQPNVIKSPHSGTDAQSTETYMLLNKNLSREYAYLLHVLKRKYAYISPAYHQGKHYAVIENSEPSLESVTLMLRDWSSGETKAIFVDLK